MTKQKQLSYQTNAINATINHLQDNKEFKLQSPTGSGKTFIISKIIDQYLENDILNSNSTTFVFIAPSTGNLDFQGYEKISSYLNKDWVKGYSTEYIGTSKNKNSSSSKSYLQNIDYFKENTVYFIGWQMFKKGTRITEIDSEKNDIYKVISNTKIKGINIVLIVDEAHREVKSAKNDINTKQIIIDQLDPYKIIKVSATLEQVKEEPDFIITYDNVRQESAIKQNVIISKLNDKVKNIDKFDEDEQLILSAIEKQKEIRKEYIRKKIDINPLILIQIPDNVVIDKEINTEEQLLNKIKNILEKYNYKLGYNYAIWLDKNKTIKNKNEILDDNSPIDILIFKTAIATGWDIPRANILVRIREAKTKAFNIQTLGRILRNPLFKYYDNELIDNAFVFTKDDKYKEYIKQENIVSDEEDYFTVSRSKKSQNSNFSIDKVIINDNDYNQDNALEFISEKIINDKKFEKFLIWNHPSSKSGNVKISSKDIIELDQNSIQNKIDKNNEKYEQQMINFAPKITLFDLYIKYKTITKSSLFISNVLNLIENKIHRINKKIKDFYWACIYNWNFPFIKINDNWLTLKEWITYEKNQYTKSYISIEYLEFKLPKEYKISTKKFEINNWDEVNSFNVDLKTEFLDSENEIKFYDKFKSKYDDEDHIHIFRNGISPQYDYYVEYMDDDNQKRKFFPDFIVINEKQKSCLVLEAKGKDKKTDIDKNTKNKFKAFKSVLERNKHKNSYKFKDIVKVNYDKNNNDVIFQTKNENLRFKDLKKIIDE